MSVTITEEFILSGARVGPRQSGWKARQLEILGEPWPPKHGWKKRAIGRVISDVEAKEFQLLKEFHGARGRMNGAIKAKVAAAHEMAQRLVGQSDKNIDNSFESVLWRKLACDFRVHAGWRLEDMEKRFREVVRETLRDHPPQITQ